MAKKGQLLATAGLSGHFRVEMYAPTQTSADSKPKNKTKKTKTKKGAKRT